MGVGGCQRSSWLMLEAPPDPIPRPVTKEAVLKRPLSL